MRVVKSVAPVQVAVNVQRRCVSSLVILSETLYGFIAVCLDRRCHFVMRAIFCMSHQFHCRQLTLSRVYTRDTLWSIGPSGAVFTRMKISRFSELLVVRKGSLKRCWRFLRMMIYLPSWAHRVRYLTICTSHCGILGVANPLVQEHWGGNSMLSLLTVSTSWSFVC